MLTAIIFIPLFAALAILCVPREYRPVIRAVALLATLATAVLALFVFFRFDAGFKPTAAQLQIHGHYQFAQMFEWLPGLGINYHVGVDGLNVGLILMGAIVAFAAACASWEIKTHEKEFYLLLMVMTGGILGAFASLNLFFFYAFHEFALVPTFIMIGVWGRGENKNYATFNITMYLTLGALVALFGLIALYLQLPAQMPDGSPRSFDIVKVTEYFKATPMSAASQHFIFPLLLFGFGILVSLWPFHTWAPLGYGAAPTATAMLHAGVLKKFGLYGILRIALPLMPAGAQAWMQVLAFLCLGNIVYCGWVAMRQRDLNQLIGNSSVAHMGFAFLGLASLSLIGVTGAVIVMIAHGFLAALTFGLSGYLRAHTGTLNMDEMGGLLRRIPFIGAALIMAMLAGCGLPGFANFAGEITVLFGTWKSGLHSGWQFAAAAAWGALIIGAVYMLRAVRSVLHGEATGPDVPDANAWRKVPFVLLLAALLVFGFFPGLLADKIKPDADQIVKQATATAVPEKMHTRAE
ncbi:MAG: NADH-quinone oxidoreductase subunit [Verrucomicrobiota bacterium]|jgi:NADH-quinone oxidoreductase subunit M